MNGREERDLGFEMKLDEIISNSPEVIKRFRYDLIEMTSWTKVKYVGIAKDFVEYMESAGMSVYEAKKNDINRYMESVRYKESGDEASVSTRKLKLAAVKRFYKYLIDEELVDRNPCESVKSPVEHDEKDIIFMTPEEVTALKGNLKKSPYMRTRDLALITIGVHTGMRISAILNINLEDIDFEKHKIRTVEKGNKVRDIIITKETEDVIRDWIKYRNADVAKKGFITNALFTSSKSGRMTYSAAERIIKKRASVINKHITPHKMRSTFLTNAYEASGGDIYAVMDLAGHKNIANTRRYVKASEERRRDIIDKLGGIY